MHAGLLLSGRRPVCDFPAGRCAAGLRVQLPVRFLPCLHCATLSPHRQRLFSLVSPELFPLPTLRTGSYVVDVKVADTAYHTTWDLQVKGGRIRGISHWICCPGPRHDALRGTFSGRKVTIQRDCSGQGWKGGCVQTYTGVIKGNRIEGTGTGTGLDGLPVSWVLHLQTGKPTP